MTTALYQKYRPRKFGQLIGQEDVANSLREAVARDRVSHAYIFVGERGCGKTSAARILAAAVNCTNLQPEGEPCNQCLSCEEIRDGVSPNVINYDAGTNSGVDSMREIIANANLVSPGKKKVIIIDEAHLLSPAAESAMLLTLEEPPSGVIFILCTTDPRRINAPIMSRCQKRQFKLVNAQILARHLKMIADREELQVTKDQIIAAVHASGGSVRSALSELEGASLSDEQAVVWSVELLKALTTKDKIKVLSVVAESVQDSMTSRDLAEQLFAMLREVFFIEMGTESLLTTPDWGNRVEVAHALGAKNITTAIDRLGEAIQMMQGGADNRVSLEIALCRYCVMAV